MTARALLASLLFGLVAVPMFAAVPEEPPAAYVLCYHIVESPQDPRMEISRETFRQQMRYLALTGYNVIPLHDLYEYVIGRRASIPRNAVVITIDDGWRSTYTQVFPEMEGRHFPFTVFIYPRIIGQTANALTWKQVREMVRAGVDIQSHSFSHPFLTQRRHASLNDREYASWLEHELVDSKRVLEQQTGHKVDFLAYPYGDFDHHLAAACARAGYEAALTCEFGAVRRGSDPLRMKRLVIDKRMDFASFRHYLGNTRMELARTEPLPNQVLEPEQPVILSARIPHHEQLDPKSVGMALLSAGTADRFSYDARDGSITVVIGDALKELKGRYQRALVWATNSKTGKRMEAIWTFEIPHAQPAVTVQPASMTAPAIAPAEQAPVTAGSRSVAEAPAASRGTAEAATVERPRLPRGQR